jgi:PKD domain
MRRYSLTARRLILALSCTIVASLAVVASAQAIVANDAGNTYGVALVPDTTLPTGMAITPSSSCTDPSLAPDLTWLTVGRVSPLCYHGGPIIPKNETYALTWDPDRLYWAGTRNYVEQFLSDVQAGNGTFTSPYAVTPQYTDSSGARAANDSLYAGGCIDYGNPTGNSSLGGYTCQFGANQPSGTGNNYPANGCTPSGMDVWYGQPNGPIDSHNNLICLTDAQLKLELKAMLPQMSLPGGNKPGYTPLAVLLTPPGVEVCLDASGNLCSANSDSTPTDPGAPQAQFCSYHSQVDVGGSEISYVVQPWTAQWGQGVGCDDPAAPNIVPPVDQKAIADQVGSKLVSPLSQAQLAALTDPDMNGWFNKGNGAEINDNGCGPLGGSLDNVAVGPTTYPLQREFNNAGAIETDPNALPCSGVVNLVPQFIVPGPVDAGDTVLFDGSVTNSTLMVHNGDYKWNFGDGTTGTGPSVSHAYANGGTYSVKLTVTDRGGNVATTTETMQVFGSDGQPVPPAASPSSGSGGNSLNVRLLLLPQSLKSVLHSGISVRVTSNAPANGIATVWISRAAAKKAHIRVGKSPTVRIGIGTVSSVKSGTVTLRLHLSRGIAKKLSRLRHVSMTVRLALVGTGNRRVAIDAAGRY